MILDEKFGTETWFKDVTRYFSLRFPAVELRLQEAFRYVELHRGNRRAFSYEFCSILRDLGSAFGSIADLFVRGTSDVLKSEYNFGDYRHFFFCEVPNICERTVCIRPCLPAGIVVPFEEMKEGVGTPSWWDAYNKVKHNEYNEFRLGNLENCITALSALALIGNLIGEFFSDMLFVNVGIAYSTDSVDMSQERRLFPRLNNQSEIEIQDEITSEEDTDGN